MPRRIDPAVLVSSLGYEALASSAPSGQLIQQRLRVLQVRRIETLTEPAVDRAEQITSFNALALVAPEPGEAGRCPQLKELCALLLGNGYSLSYSR
jgi:hypothetical protein